jgi:colanic acid/amylovoran biosynthesis protein
MKLLLIDQPIRNRGDESAHKALVRRLLQADRSITITVPYRYEKSAMIPMMVDDPRVEYVQVKPGRYSYKFRIIGQEYGLRIAWLMDPAIRKMIRLYKKADLVLASPGGINLGGFQDWVHLFHLELAQYLRKPLAYFGRSVGPFPEDSPKQQLFHKLSKEIISYMSFVSIRDRISDEFIPGAVKTLDSAFLETPQAELPDLPEGKYVVFVPNELNWHYAYKGVGTKRIRNFYSDIAALIHARYPDHRIIYLPQLYMGRMPVECDRDFFMTICSGDDYVAPEDWSSDVQQQVIRGASCLVGARYHSVVFAINNAVPFVALSYEHKIAGLCESLGFSYIDISHAFEEGIDLLPEIDRALLDPQCDKEKTAEAKHIAEKGFESFTDYLLGRNGISVIVPNYNHARFLKQRLDSIFNQTVKPLEVIVLDDASTDDSLSVLEPYEDRIRLIVNETNGGSPFPQWKKGMEAAKGNLIWIAESDDFADTTFLETAARPFQTDHSCTLSFVRSVLTDAEGNDYGPHPYQKDMAKPFKSSGKKFITNYLARKNQVVNASSAVFSRKTALGIDNGYETYGGSGDIVFWAGMAENGNIYYNPQMLNHFRQHGSNRTKEYSVNGKGEAEALRVIKWMKAEGYINGWPLFMTKVYHYRKLRYSNNNVDPELLNAWGGRTIGFFAYVKYLLHRHDF